MDRRTALVWIGATTVGSSFLSAAGEAAAEDDATPSGPWLPDEQGRSLEAFHDYEELMNALEDIEQDSLGWLSLETIGTSKPSFQSRGKLSVNTHIIAR
ncbi:hypothetical protein [Halostagnicola sp. A-GB9-2]|uniref:hypothetical protein n=1 Tax=Halostagnicola sp. A-GB9-2 TaxID=3048066 RepID=UPI0024BF8529|nr:hypothetical protein [Halostagnicola sp. A-GB9-2]MDJ1430893.1 hypothetical protein [Halostagnicola sp. A-GB9-2]